MKIGLDFDNTLVSYADTFYKAALAEGLISPDVGKSKLAVRTFFRESNQEIIWTQLQGLVYGKYMDFAALYAGSMATMEALHGNGHELFIVSHKTRYPYEGPRFDLHLSARNWIETHVLSQTKALAAEHVFFEESKEAKLRRIDSLGCDVFLDDLPEILLHEVMPKAVAKYLFDPDGLLPEGPEYKKVASWEAFGAALGEATR